MSVAAQQVGTKNQRRPGSCGVKDGPPSWEVAADATPCGSSNVVLPAKISVFQACLANGGGGARLTLAVSLHAFAASGLRP